MPMFQVDPRRSVAVDPRAVPGAVAGQDSGSESVADHLDRLLGEHLLPLRIRESGEDEPYLLAVDASGQAVVVDVVGLLDEEALLRALRYAGRAANLGEEDLALAYRAGPQRFATDLAAFRTTVPVTTFLSTSVAPGARLLLVCTHVAEGVEDVVDFLLQSASQVQILRVGVVDGPDDTRIIDVSPLERRPPSRRGLEPDPRQSRARLTPPRRPEAAEETRRLPTVVPPPFAVRAGAQAAQPTVQPAPVWAPVLTPEASSPAASADPAPAGGSPAAGTVADADAHRWGPVEPTGGLLPTALPFAFTGVTPGAGPDERLLELAVVVGAPVPLVWPRPRRGEVFEALLHADGLIELPDGSLCLDPHEAAALVSGAEAVDGWHLWRVERADGPTLFEALTV
ncbi:MAG: hypothetical protein JWP95_1971 [Actinotalea sp.]|nr:hypothetical protein [Actinotalea sp.]